MRVTKKHIIEAVNTPESKTDKTEKSIEKVNDKDINQAKELKNDLEDIKNLEKEIFGIEETKNKRKTKEIIKVSELLINENKDYLKDRIKENLYSKNITERMYKSLEEDIINSNHPLKEANIFPESYGIPSDASLIIKEFENSVKKCREAFDIDKIDNFKLYESMDKILNEIKQIEEPNKKKLEKLATKLIINEFNIPEGAMKLNAELVDEVKLKNKSKSIKELDEVFENHEQISEVIYALNKNKGIYAFAEGAINNSNILYKNNDELTDINPRLSNYYNKLMCGANYLDYVVESADKKVVGGDVQCDYKQNNDKSITPIITAKAISFPILVRELYRGVMEVLSTHGVPENELIAEYVLNNNDYVECQPWFNKFGPRIWKKFCGNITPEDSNLKYEVFARMIKKEPNDMLSLMKEIIAGTKKAKQTINEIVSNIKQDKINDSYFDASELM
jgi:hypothetical protein